MATMTITIPDNRINEALDAFAEAWNYDQNKLNGETKQQFVRRYLTAYLERTFKRGKKELHDDQFSEPTDIGVGVS